jgi:RNA polymerase sigma-70 factor (ECF subfamily)
MHLSRSNIPDLLQTALSMEKRLRRHLQKYTDSKSETDDLLQTTYERLLSRKRVENPSEPERYIWKAATNVGVDWLRKRRGRYRVALESIDGCDLIEKPRDPLYDVSEMEDRRLLERIVARLPTQCRRVFCLHRVEGYSLREVSDQLGITVATVKAHLARASVEIARALSELPPAGGR